MASRSRTQVAALEISPANAHPLLSWRSIVGGLVVTGFAFITLLSLGTGLGGIGLEDGTTVQRASAFAGAWFLLSALLALFAGSYFASRMSPFHTVRVGSAQGLVIASIFFGALVFQTVGVVGLLGKVTGNALSGAASAAGMTAQTVAQNPAMNEAIEDAIGDLNLKSDVGVVVGGVSSRLLRGNVEGAKTYLSRQTGITPADAETRIAALRAKADQALVEAREATATALKATGWTAFFTLILGLAASIGGGALGTRANLNDPISREQASSGDFRTVPA